MSDLQLRASSLQEAESRWDRLADRLEASPFRRPGWSRVWQECFGGPALTVLEAVRGDRVVGVLPLQRRIGRAGSPTNWHTPAFGPLAEDPAVARRLVTGALERTRWRLRLEFLDEDDAALVQRAAQDAGWSTTDHVLQVSPYAVLPGTFEDYRASLSRNTRKQLNRKRREASEVGPLRLDVCSSFDPREFATFVRLEGSGWKAARGSAIADNPRELRFYRDLARWASDRGWLRLVVLRVADEPVAADLALEVGRSHFLLKTGYAPAWDRLSPGRLLREESIRRACEKGVRSYELLGQDTRWKRSWAGDVRRLHRVTAFAPGPVGRALQLADQRARPLASALRRRWLEHRQG